MVFPGEVAEIDVIGLQVHGHHPVRLRRRRKIRIGTPSRPVSTAEGNLAGEEDAGDVVHQEHEGSSKGNTGGQ